MSPLIQYRAVVQIILEKEIDHLAKRMLGGVDDRTYVRMVGQAAGLKTALGALQEAEDQLYGRAPQPEQPKVEY